MKQLKDPLIITKCLNLLKDYKLNRYNVKLDISDSILAKIKGLNLHLING